MWHSGVIFWLGLLVLDCSVSSLLYNSSFIQAVAWNQIILKLSMVAALNKGRGELLTYKLTTPYSPFFKGEQT